MTLSIKDLSEVKVIALRLPNRVDNNEFESLLKLVSRTKKERILRLYNKKDAYRKLFADILVRGYVASKMNIFPKDVSFEYNEFGKPFVSNCCIGPSIEFSVSHSGVWVVAAFHSNPIGIDIEKLKPIDIKAIGSRFFSEFEYQTLSRSGYKLQDFYQIWTLKESYIKCLGYGLSKKLQSFSIMNICDSYYSVIDDTETEQYFLKTFELDKEYKSAICTKKVPIQENIHILNFYSLMSLFF